MQDGRQVQLYAPDSTKQAPGKQWVRKALQSPSAAKASNSFANNLLCVTAQHSLPTSVM